MNFYPHHIKDFNHSTRHLTRVERSVYRDATEHYYVTEQPLTLDKNRLARKLLCRTDEEIEALNNILEEFFDETDEGFYHERCDEEIEKYKSNISAKAKAGKASAEARRKRAAKKRARKTNPKEQKTTTDEQLLNSSSTPVANQEPRTSNQEPVTKNHINTSDDSEKQTDLLGDEIPDNIFDGEKAFDEFWNLYPRKDNKKRAKIIFIRKIDDVLIFSTVIEALKNQIEFKWSDPEYIPMPTTWLNGERWNDEITVSLGDQALDEFINDKSGGSNG